MSHAERFGTAVYNGLKDYTYSETTGLHTLATVGEIARCGGVSSATAKKYLKHLEKMNLARIVKIGKREFWQYTGDGRDI